MVKRGPRQNRLTVTEEAAALMKQRPKANGKKRARTWDAARTKLTYDLARSTQQVVREVAHRVRVEIDPATATDSQVAEQLMLAGAVLFHAGALKLIREPGAKPGSSVLILALEVDGFELLPVDELPRRPGKNDPPLEPAE